MRTLTDRYVHAVVRRVPEAMRPEVTADVTAMIADMVEARHAERSAGIGAGAITAAEAGAGTSATAEGDLAVESAVLEELGDPAALAREYSDSPQHLIGPQYFPVYTWFLTWVLPVVLVVALVANGLSYTLSTPDAHIGGLLGTAIGESIPAVFIAFAAVTILFAIIERATPMGTQTDTGASSAADGDADAEGDESADGAAASGAGTAVRQTEAVRRGGGTQQTGGVQQAGGAQQAGGRVRASAARRPQWTVDSLEDIPPGGTSVRADAIVSLVFLVLLALVPFVPTTALYVGGLNDGETFINPDLGVFWLIGYWVLLALTAVGAVWRIRRRRLSTGLVAMDMITDLVMAVFLTVAFLTQDVLHPAVEVVNSLPVELWVIPLIWAITIWDQVSTVRGYRTHLAAHGRS